MTLFQKTNSIISEKVLCYTRRKITLRQKRSYIISEKGLPYIRKRVTLYQKNNCFQFLTVIFYIGKG